MRAPLNAGSAVEPDAHHCPDEMLELLYRHPHIKVRVCSRLFP